MEAVSRDYNSQKFNPSNHLKIQILPLTEYDFERLSTKYNDEIFNIMAGVILINLLQAGCNPTERSILNYVHNLQKEFMLTNGGNNSISSQIAKIMQYFNGVQDKLGESSDTAMEKLYTSYRNDIEDKDDYDGESIQAFLPEISYFPEEMEEESNLAQKFSMLANQFDQMSLVNFEEVIENSGMGALEKDYFAHDFALTKQITQQYLDLYQAANPEKKKELYCLSLSAEKTLENIEDSLLKLPIRDVKSAIENVQMAYRTMIDNLYEDQPKSQKKTLTQIFTLPQVEYIENLQDFSENILHSLLPIFLCYSATERKQIKEKLRAQLSEKMRSPILYLELKCPENIHEIREIMELFLQALQDRNQIEILIPTNEDFVPYQLSDFFEEKELYFVSDLFANSIKKYNREHF